MLVYHTNDFFVCSYKVINTRDQSDEMVGILFESGSWKKAIFSLPIFHVF